MSQDFKFIECNINNSFEKDKNNSRWINKISDGMVIEENSKLIVQSAYVNIVGAGSEVIQFDNFKIGTNNYYKFIKTTGSYGIFGGFTFQYDGKYELQSDDVFDNKAKIQFTYYKNSDAQNSYPLPYCGYTYPTAPYENFMSAKGNQKVAEIENGIESSDFKSKFNYSFPIDNKRYTIMECDPSSRYDGQQRGDNNNKIQERTLARLEYYPYINEVDIEIPEGFSTPSAISQIVTDKLNKMTPPEIKKMTVFQEINDSQYDLTFPFTYRDLESVEVNGSFFAESSVFKLVDCASIRNFYSEAYTSFYNIKFNGTAKLPDATVGSDPWFENNDSEVQAYQDAFKYIGVYNPDVFMAGRYINPDVSYPLARQEIFKIIEPVILSTGAQYIATIPIKTNIKYDKDTLKNFSYLFNYQTNDSELYANKSAYDVNATKNNSVFLHMSVNDSPVATWKDNVFGTNESMLPMPQHINPLDYPEFNNNMTNAIYIAYDETKKNIFEVNNAYGVFERYTRTDAGFIGDECCIIKIRIHIKARPVGDPPVLEYYNDFFNFPLSVDGNNNRQIGWDRSFSANGNQSILLFSGVTPNSQLSAEFDSRVHTPLSGFPIFKNQFRTPAGLVYDYGTAQDKIFLGADSILFNFNNSRFTLESLHTARKEFNNSLAGQDNTILQGVDKFLYRGISVSQDDAYYKDNDVIFPTSINPNAGNPIYQISPSIANQQTIEISNVIYPEANRAVNFLGMCKSNTVFDSNCGIFIDNWGVDETSFIGSLWDKLGFSQDQVYSYLFNNLLSEDRIILDRQFRHLDSGVNIIDNQIYPFTTNANLGANQITSWKTNPFGQSFFNTLTMPNNMMVVSKIRAGATHKIEYQNVAPYQVTSDQISIKMYSLNLPKKTNIPFYQIRCDILPSIEYFGGNKEASLRLPCIAIVNKSFPGADYYSVSGDSSMEFIFKKRTVLNSIITEIYDNNGRPARLDSYSSIIYRIEGIYNPPEILPFTNQAEYDLFLQNEEEKKKKKKK